MCPPAKQIWQLNPPHLWLCGSVTGISYVFSVSSEFFHVFFSSRVLNSKGQGISACPQWEEMFVT